MAVLVDSNVLLDVMTGDPQWFSWSAEALARYANDSVLVINPLIYAEVSVRFERVEELERALPLDTFARASLCRGRWDSWRVRALSRTAPEAARGRRRSRIFISARMPPCAVTGS